jgi:hypothetical protein
MILLRLLLLSLLLLLLIVFLTFLYLYSSPFLCVHFSLDFFGGIPQDMILRSFLPLRIGSTYKVQPGDTLARIAARLRTTVKKILEVNPDIKTPQIESNQVSLFACLSRDLSLYLHPLNPILPPPPFCAFGTVY